MGRAVTAARAKAAMARFLAESAERLRAIAERQVAGGARNYVRARDLPKLLGCTADEAERADSEAIILMLMLRLNAEKNRARTNHWASSGMSGHRAMSLRIALAAERAMQAVAEAAE